MPIILDESQLQRRRRTIQGLLKPLRGGVDVACAFASNTGPRTRILATHDGQVPSESYRDWRFRTRQKVIEAQYFEQWEDLKGGRQYEWVKAYLHLFHKPSAEAEPIELIALHADPPEKHDHMRGPHVHVVASTRPLPDCHVPLNLRELKTVLTSADSLTQAIKTAILIIDHEVLSRY